MQSEYEYYECAQSSFVGREKSQCNNVIGSYFIQCTEGYLKDGLGNFIYLRKRFETFQITMRLRLRLPQFIAFSNISFFEFVFKF